MSLVNVFPGIAICISLFAVYFARRSSQIALLANAPSVFIQSGIRPLDEHEDQLIVALVNSGPTEALDVYIELYSSLDQGEINNGFPLRLPLSTWREPRILAKSSIRLTSRMIMYRGLGLPPRFYASGFLFAWVFWKDRLGGHHARFEPVYDLDGDAHADTSKARTIGPTKVSPLAHARWKAETRRRRRLRQKRSKPHQVIDPRIRTQSVYSVKAEPGDFAKPLEELFPTAAHSTLSYPLLTITSEQEGDAPRMYVVTDEPNVVDTVWTYLTTWAEQAADTQLRRYRSLNDYTVIRIPWNHATVVAKLESILDQVRAAYQENPGRTKPPSIHLNLSETDGNRVSASSVISGHS
ncbi:hypothetical protein ACUXPF_003498 [Sphingomonas sanguinis]|jgi:hypothetical protein